MTSGESLPEEQFGPRRVAMRILYDGTGFRGWQRQRVGRTVQGVLEDMLSRISGDRPVSVVGAGRTDAGVHAAGQMAHADVNTPFDDSRLLHALRRMAPEDVSVRALRTVDPDFHARFAAHRRTYRYRLMLEPDPFRGRFAALLWYQPDVDRLRQSAVRLLGSHDFTALSKHNPDTENRICCVEAADWVVPDDLSLEFIITADRFLYGMVRLLVGIQLDVARGRLEPSDIDAIIASRDRHRQSPSVPARGLVLERVGYPNFDFVG